MRNKIKTHRDLDRDAFLSTLALDVEKDPEAEQDEKYDETEWKCRYHGHPSFVCLLVFWIGIESLFDSIELTHQYTKLLRVLAFQLKLCRGTFFLTLDDPFHPKDTEYE